MDADFTAAEVVELMRRTKARKAVVGPAAPWLMRLAAFALAPLLAAEFNAWRRLGAPAIWRRPQLHSAGAKARQRPHDTR